MNVLSNNFKILKWFYKILFILSIICPIVLFIFRICTGFFSYTHDFVPISSMTHRFIKFL